MRVVTVGAALLAAVGLSSCSAQPDAAERKSPLEQMYTEVFGERDDEAIKAEFVKQEEKIAACMKEAGFEYTPQSLELDGLSQEPDPSEVYDPEDEADVREYGYAIWKSPGVSASSPESVYVDPNEKYVSSLSEAEQQSYYEVLYGDGSQDFGCIDTGGGVESGYDALQEEYSDLIQQMEQLYQDVESSPEMLEVHSKWAQCMAEAGYTYKNQIDAQQELVNAYFPEDGEELSYDDTGNPIGTPEMQKLFEREVKTALDDLNCRKKTDFVNASFQIRVDLEQQFVDENKTALQTYIAALKAVLEG